MACLVGYYYEVMRFKVACWFVSSFEYILMISWCLQDNKYLIDMLGSYESALGEQHPKVPTHIAQFPPPFQSVPCNPIVLDMAYNIIEFPNLENRMKKEKKSILKRFWG
jgi:hypothetical protein